MIKKSEFFIMGKTGRIRKTHDILEWGKWFETNPNRIIIHDTIGKIKISTIFLGLDHNFSNKGKPILWETMIFGGKHDQYTNRYSSRKDALKGHKKALKLVTSKKI